MKDEREAFVRIERFDDNEQCQTDRVRQECRLLGIDPVCTANDGIRLMGELPDGLRRGTPFQENLIEIVSYSSASGGLAFVLIFRGLLGTTRAPAGTPRNR